VNGFPLSIQKMIVFVKENTQFTLADFFNMEMASCPMFLSHFLSLENGLGGLNYKARIYPIPQANHPNLQLTMDDWQWRAKQRQPNKIYLEKSLKKVSIDTILNI
jgi:hypothetical protein